MFKNLLLTFFLLFSSFITILPSKKENTNLTDYCYSLEKILSRNSLKKSKNIQKKYKSFAKDITFYSTQKTKGAFVNKIIDQYKISKKSYFMNFVPNQFFCFSGYWIEEINPGTFQSIFYKKSNYTDCYEYVCNIKCKPMKITVMQINEIRYCASKYPIIKIS